ncbi:MAG: zinc ribbon domain-containing protein [Gemmataceae bacterium]|nr:zinc ribbon domain-containing protein [Gemmataceae bacterium]
MNERCPACGAANPDREALFCAFCGGRLEDMPPAVACPACGGVNEADSRFCSACGAALTPADAPASTAAPGTASCPACAAANPADARFCFACGSAIPSHSAVEQGEIACPSCQTRNPRDARFCLACGEPIPEEEDRRRLGAALPFGLAGAGGGLAGAAGTTGLGGLGAATAPAAMAGAGAGLGAEALAGAGSSALAGAGAVQTGAMAGAGMAQSGMMAGAGMAPSSAMAGAGALESPTALAGAGAASPAEALGGAGATSVPPSAPPSPPMSQPPPAPSSPPATQPPPAPQPSPPPQPSPQPQQFRPGGFRHGLGRVVRVVAFTSVAAGTVVMALAVLFALLMFTGDPEPCVARTSTPAAAAVARAAQKWEAFKAAGPGTTVSFDEQEATSRGVAYLEERDVPLKNLQVYFCPDGHAEVKGRVTILGRDVNVLFRGHLDVSGGKNRVVVDSVDAGNLPSWVGTRVVNEILDRNNARNLPLGLTLTASTSSDGVHTLKK